MVQREADALLAGGPLQDVLRARQVRTLVDASRQVNSTEFAGTHVLYPSEYAARAESLAAARQLVGGIEIERLRGPEE